ncbi:MAG: hypothetical protein M9945_04170 [Aquamicrobium sp.]|nr:hypothetical protein [Aquamicrobium sp.]
METNGPARRGHTDVLTANTGWRIDPIKWARRAAASKLLAEQSEMIADALERMGTPARLDAEITAIGAVTGKVETLPAYRAIRFLPTVAARDRRPVLNGMKYFIQHHRAARFFRYAVITAPEPVPFGGELRKAIQALSRRVSKWATEARDADVEVLFRGIEFTRATAADRDADAARRMPSTEIGPPDAPLTRRFGADTVLYHVHANILTWPQRAMKDSEWSAFLRMTWRAVKGHWQDNGRIQKAEELVKNCLKPADIREAPDEEVLWLYLQTERLKLAQPMGPFASFMSELEDAGEKVVRVRSGEDGRLQRVRKSSRLNHHASDDPGNGPEGDESQPAPSVLDDADLAPGTDGGSRSRPTNLVLGVSLPQWRHTPWAEPLILVQRYDPFAPGAGDRARLEEIDTEKGLARIDWDSNGAPDPSVALDIAARATAGTLSAIDVAMIEAEDEAPPIAGGAADSYRVHTCGPTVPAAPAQAGAWSGVAVSWEDDLLHPRPGWTSKLPPPDLEDDQIPFDPPLSAFVLAMRAEHGCASPAMAA